MKRTVSAVEARQRLGELLEGVFYRGDEVIIERAGKRMGVVVPIERYEVMAQSGERVRTLLERTHARNAAIPPEQVERDVTAASVEVRRTKRRKRAAGE